MFDENKNIYISRWLLLITFLTALMIIIGGLTRLTESGLSITKWDLFVGILPPLNTMDWDRLFSLYKKIPEFKLLKSSMTLEEFKVIFWWEYSHRLLGRIIGLSYLIPLLFFTYKKLLNKKELIIFYIILFLIVFQGVMGWYMVESGLTERTDVSHYRLSIHLTMAFIIFILTFWNYIKYSQKKYSLSHKKLPNYLVYSFVLLLLIQISVGALVSGLDGGKIYQTWPLMNQNYFPDDSNFIDLFSIKSLETPSLIQFIHRNIAYLIFFLFFLVMLKIYKDNSFFYLRKITLIILLALLFQILLGILTILSGAQIFLASMHQIGSIILISLSLILAYKNT
tara:strand:- start:35 stop:1051 length:1017 start_codon:yes stop_codon:yes gene_type:complete